MHATLSNSWCVSDRIQRVLGFLVVVIFSAGLGRHGFLPVVVWMSPSATKNTLLPYFLFARLYQNWTCIFRFIIVDQMCVSFFCACTYSDPLCSSILDFIIQFLRRTNMEKSYAFVKTKFVLTKVYWFQICSVITYEILLGFAFVTWYKDFYDHIMQNYTSALTQWAWLLTLWV